MNPAPPTKALRAGFAKRIAEYALDLDDTLADAARKIIGKQVSRMKEHAPATKRGDDPEALHDMRVATRRLRFALRLFAPWMPSGRADRLRGELRRTALVLGRVRDLDVFLMELPAMMDRASLPQEQQAGVTSPLKRKRGQGRAVLVRSLKSKRHRRMTRALERMPMISEAQIPAKEEAGRMIREAGERIRDFAKKADFTKREDLHRLRILFKRLRYTCEYFRDLYGPALDGAIAHFIRFQDCLGKYQDGVVGSAVLESLVKARSPQTVDRSPQQADRRPQTIDRSNAGNNKSSPDISDAITKLQEVLRQKRGLQREEFSELWAEFPLIMRAFFKLVGRP